jgi:hypothetical protein
MTMFRETRFEDYIENNNKLSLHPKLNKLYETFPTSIDDLKNIIFYGPKGVGKYTQALSTIKRYSPSSLKYEKKMSIALNKNTYYYKISDVHFEVDMSLLGCNSKMLWNEIYTQITDIILSKSGNTGIILCKHFHNIHSELLESFYSYMQTTTYSSIKMKFIIITEELSFIPNNILNCCRIIRVPEPTKTLHNKCLNTKTTSAEHKQLKRPHELICRNLLDCILNVEEYKFLELRDKLYDILIYDLDITNCVWFILETLIEQNKIKHEHMSDVLIKTYTFFQYYNNNYRPIYHLESYVFYLIKKIYGFQ